MIDPTLLAARALAREAGNVQIDGRRFGVLWLWPATEDGQTRTAFRCCLWSGPGWQDMGTPMVEPLEVDDVIVVSERHPLLVPPVDLLTGVPDGAREARAAAEAAALSARTGVTLEFDYRSDAGATSARHVRVRGVRAGGIMVADDLGKGVVRSFHLGQVTNLRLAASETRVPRWTDRGYELGAR